MDCAAGMHCMEWRVGCRHRLHAGCYLIYLLIRGFLFLQGSIAVDGDGQIGVYWNGYIMGLY